MTNSIGHGGERIELRDPELIAVLRAELRMNPALADLPGGEFYLIAAVGWHEQYMAMRDAESRDVNVPVEALCWCALCIERRSITTRNLLSGIIGAIKQACQDHDLL